MRVTGTHFPRHSRTLWELTQIRPKQRLIELIANGTINSGMTREETVALRHQNIATTITDAQAKA